MSLLLLIVCSVALALLSQEVRRLRERVDMLEAGATASPISAAGEAPRTVYVPPEPFLAVDRGALPTGGADCGSGRLAAGAGCRTL